LGAYEVTAQIGEGGMGETLNIFQAEASCLIAVSS
jgi:hypothetical protein